MLRKLLVGALFALVLSLTTLGVGSKSASAEVTENAWFDVTGRVVTNPCTGLDITLSGTIHTVWYTTPQDTLIMRYNIHYTGTDSAGTRYVLNATELMEHWDWPKMAPLTDSIRFNVISKGSNENFVMTLTLNYTETWPAPYDIAFTCKG